MTLPPAVFLLVAATTLLPFGGAAHRKTEQGNRLFGEGELDDALRAYTEAQVEQPEAPELYYDIGNVLFRQGDFAGAAEAYSRALLGAPEALVGPAAYNLGNARFEQQQYQDAVTAYERALRASPDDPDAKRNLELALRAVEQQQQQQQQQQQEQPQETPPPDQQKPQPQPSGESEDGERDAPQPSGEGQEEPQQPEEPSGQMTPDQVGALLDQVAEQEAENLKQQALTHRRPTERTPEKDW